MLAHRGQRDNRAGLDVAEESDLGDDVLADGQVGAAEDDVGLDADGAQLFDGVLGGLGLELGGGGDLAEGG